MESVAQQIREMSLSKDEILKNSPPVCIGHGKVAELIGKISQKQNESIYRRSDIPPKLPIKYNEMPQVPSSRQVSCSREPLYSQPLIGVEKTISVHMPFRKVTSEFGIADTEINRKSTLDNPAILEQQLEALAYHKLQMEKKGLLGVPAKPTQSLNSFSEPLSKTLSKSLIYCNLDSVHKSEKRSELLTEETQITASTYANVHEADVKAKGSSHSSTQKMISVCTNFISNNEIDDLPPPPSPESAVSSSYSELRRATSEFNKPIDYLQNVQTSNSSLQIYANQYALQHDAISKNSSTYDSIYEPINPRPSADMFPRESCNMYNSYVNDNIPSISNELNVLNSIEANKTLYIHGNAKNKFYKGSTVHRNDREGLKNYISIPTDPVQELENYGRCVKCNSRVLGESSGCTAMDQIYHISCFTCTDCQINLQGKPFYALDGKPYCEYDYLQTLEKCSVCMKPILERILRATGKPYHPQCFTCVVCGKSLDGLLFTVDATNQNYCITDFHKKFAPRCCVCKQPIMPFPGQEETIRVVALDHSFHLECYKCEDCGLLLSSEAEGRGCYPLDDHVLCKSCNAQRVQALTKRMTSEH
ncbi:LIM domain-containing protein C4F6.12 isoform X1 [Drosophila teissieri]|uniref:LIM domain-containing protein C4F6.12 isoform X1 n=2 Tax=Drosophila teissieri TaxID=7243 RepID=UPI001CBA4486|nr:LIM domain-containing protein C4F6.12 isoform X1 [Drosophila teissieri]XP_043657485.1 LIM domain-containing protein C4F6.12 isoform X1 [Drosophila teissieri]XP_043657486.1 LIM domain-containing protein C4F6.12 isoform X1 [Drosophila teissieri]